MEPSLDNIFATAPSNAPAGGGTSAAPAAQKSSGPSLDNIFATTPSKTAASAPVASAPAPTPDPVQSAVQSTSITPPKTEGIFSKALGVIKGGLSKVLSSKAFTSAPTPDTIAASGKPEPAYLKPNLQPKDNSTAGIIENTISGVPKALFNFLGPGKILDAINADPEDAANMNWSDIGHSVIPAAGQFVGQPVADITGVATGPKTYHVPIVGDISNIQQNAVTAVQSGQNPWEAVVNAAPQSIFDGLVVAGMAQKVFSPREGVVATGVKTNDLPSGSEVQGDKSFQMSSILDPNTSSSHPLPANAIELLKEQGVDLTKVKGYDPTNPTYFRTTPMGNGVIKGEIVQVKPSYFSQFVSQFGGDIEKVPAEDTTTVYEKSTTPAELKGNIEGTHQTTDLHPVIKAEVKQAVQTHGVDVAHQELQTQLGVTSAEASGMIADAMKPTPQDLQAAHEATVAQINPPAPVAPAHIDNIFGAEHAPSMNEEGSATKFVSDKGLDPESISIIDNKNSIVHSPAGNEAILTELPLSAFGNPKFQTLSQDKYTAGKKIKDPIEVVLNNGKYEIHDGANRFSQAVANGDKTIPVTLEVTRDGENLSGKDLVNFSKNIEENGSKEAESSQKLELEEHISNLQTELEIRRDMLEEHKAAPLQKYMARKGDYKGSLPEVTGDSKTNTFAREGDVIAASHGFQDAEHARASFEDYKIQKEALKDLEGHISDLKSGKVNMQAGFVNYGEMIKGVGDMARKVNDLIAHESKVAAKTGTVTDALYQHEGSRKAFRQRLINIMQDNSTVLSAKEWEDLTLYDDGDRSITLNDTQQEVYDHVITPLKEMLTSDRAQIRALGGVITADLQAEQTPRYAKEHGGPIDRLIENAKKKGKDVQKTVSNGGLLTKSLGAGSKHRVFHIAVDEAGNRTVVHIPTTKDGEITAFKSGKLSNLGTKKPTVTPRSKEFYDQKVTPVLEKVASDLGIRHEIVPLKGNKAGLSHTGKNLIQTNPGAPERVLIHEIGHQIDEKYGLQELFGKDDATNYGRDLMQDQQRAVADLVAGQNAKPSYKAYTRKAAEKIAQLFEAYLHVPELFREVAPDLYNKFETFLQSHAELRPIRNIENSLEMGMTKVGGQHVGGMIGKNFVDSAGKKYVIGQALISEIEANTNVQYHKNALANYSLAVDRTHAALQSIQLLERIKDSPEFGDIIQKDDPEVPTPDGWKSVGDKLPQFRGYHMETRLAEALTDLANRQSGGMQIPVFDEVNNLLISAIVLNPVMHFPNVAMGWASSEAASGVVPGLSAKSRANFAKAFNSVKAKDDFYLSYIEHGAPFMALKQTTKNFSDAILKQYVEEVEKAPDQFDQMAKVLGYANPLKWAKALGEFSEHVTWVGNDVMYMHAILDHQDSYGSTIEEAVKEVSKRMADYRMPSRMLGSRALSVGMQSKAFMFARYHYAGVIKPWIENIKDSFDPRGEAKGGPTKEQRIAGLRTLAFFALMGLLVYPLIDKMWKGITGSKTTYESEAGAMKLAQDVQKLVTGASTPSQFAQSLAPITPALNAAIELGFNVDLYTRNPIYGNPPAEGLTNFGQSMISPLATAGRTTPGNFALSLFGVYTPSSQGKNAYNAQLYDEKPALQVELKQLVASGQTDKANALVHDFNQRLISNYQKGLLDAGQPPLTQATLPAFLKSQGVHLPGAVAQGRANQLYNNGNLTSKSSMIDTIFTYAKAIGTDPSTAFNRIFTGQKILRVDNAGLFSQDSAIIVERLPLASSEAVRADDAQQQGLSKTQMDGLQLDHFVPLEAGGTNAKYNLDLVTTQENEVLHAQVETPIAAALKAGTISRDKALEYLTRYKIGTLHEVPNQYYLDLYKNKYGSQPITPEEVVAEIASGKAK